MSNKRESLILHLKNLNNDTIENLHQFISTEVLCLRFRDMFATGCDLPEQENLYSFL